MVNRLAKLNINILINKIILYIFLKTNELDVFCKLNTTSYSTNTLQLK